MKRHQNDLYSLKKHFQLCHGEVPNAFQMNLVTLNVYDALRLLHVARWSPTSLANLVYNSNN